MITRWFGEPWPTAELRAPVCEDDDLRVPIPMGYRCSHCEIPFSESSQGIVINYSGPVVDDVSFSVVTDEGNFHVVAEHIGCMVRSVLGPEFDYEAFWGGESSGTSS